LQTWLTVAALARRLGRAESTIRSWRDRYALFVPEQTDQDGRSVYPFERIAEIQALHAQSLTPREVSAEMARRHRGAAETSVSSAAPDRLDQVLAELRALHDDVRDLRLIVDRLAAKLPH
jgi:transposase-like protein